MPNSPETNLLDLGVWMSLQSLVEACHHKSYTIHPDELDKSVCKAWAGINGYTKFNEVSNKWKEVLALIIADDGGNAKVEQCRTAEDKKTILPPILDAIEMDDDLESVVVIDDESDTDDDDDNDGDDD